VGALSPNAIAGSFWLGGLARGTRKGVLLEPLAEWLGRFTIPESAGTDC
jgi:hypothetical protein